MKNKFPILIAGVTAALILFGLAAFTQRGEIISSAQGIMATPPWALWLPVVVQEQQPTPSPADGQPRFHLPDFGADDPVRQHFAEMTVLWFGKISTTENNVDLRLATNRDALTAHFTVIDRLLWYDVTPAAATLKDYDSVSLYLDTGAGRFRMDAMLSPEGQNRAPYQAFWRWNGSAWVADAGSVSSFPGWRGEGMNNPDNDNGWTMQLTLPYAALGQSQPPAAGASWRMGVVLHDRDYSDRAQADTPWPAAFDAAQPLTWGWIDFRQPSYQPPPTPERGRTAIRQGGGMTVLDGSVGGGTTCAQELIDVSERSLWENWGNRVHNGAPGNSAPNSPLNVQNQNDVADWPCFSKTYLAFPLNSVPAGKRILSATLTLYQMGGSDPSRAPDSIIQVFRIGQDFDPATLTWNNAPPPLENVARAVVPPTVFPGWPGIPRRWDVAGVTAQAHQAGQPLRIALYSADGPRHTGKYFSSSDVNDDLINARPLLTIVWGD